MIESNRRSLYISKAVWGELKHRAFLENKTAGALIAYLLEYAIQNPETVPDLERYQARSRQIGEDRARRTARGIPDDLWDQAEKLARHRGIAYSISGLVEYLLHNYLRRGHKSSGGLEESFEAQIELKTRLEAVQQG